MKLLEYYECSARWAFWTGIAFLILSAIGVFAFYQKWTDEFIAINCFIVSVTSFIINAVQKNRLKTIEMDKDVDQAPFLETNEFVAIKRAALTLRAQLFTPDGSFVGELRDKKMNWWRWLIPQSIVPFIRKSYILVDENEKTLATFLHHSGINLRITIFDENFNQIGSYEERAIEGLTKVKGTLKDADGKIILKLETSLYLFNVTLRDEGNKFWATIQHGWMPLEWGKRFKELNTPTIHLNKELTLREKQLAFGILHSIILRVKGS